MCALTKIRKKESTSITHFSFGQTNKRVTFWPSWPSSCLNVLVSQVSPNVSMAITQCKRIYFWWNERYINTVQISNWMENILYWNSYTIYCILSLRKLLCLTFRWLQAFWKSMVYGMNMILKKILLVFNNFIALEFDRTIAILVDNHSKLIWYIPLFLFLNSIRKLYD